MAKPRWRETETVAPQKPTEQLTCLVVRSTADGFVVGRALVSIDAVEWISPTHVREWTETRPKDVVLKAEKWVNDDGSVVLKPTRTARGTPVQTVVGHQIVFGELFDSAALRAKGELGRQMQAALKGRRQYWRHLCGEALTRDLPTWTATPRGEKCEHCGKGEMKASAA